MTQDEFKKLYTSTNPHATFDGEGATHCVLECTCDDGGGPTHWAAIRNTPAAIESHFEHEELLRDIRSYEPRSCKQESK